LPSRAEFHWTIEKQYDLGEVRGRIDHLAYSAAAGTIFTAELGNGSVSALDLATGEVKRVAGLAEPQGIALLPMVDALFVATGGDGALHVFSPSLEEKAVVSIGPDADNVHANPSQSLVAVGFADGLALVDPVTNTVSASIALSGHAEGFGFDETGSRVFVNIPDSAEIAVVDAEAKATVAEWRATRAGGNFPMAVSGDRVLVGVRGSSSLDLYSAADGSLVASQPVCGDSDDVFADEKRGQVYVVCGAGEVDTFTLSGQGLALLDATATIRGARTGLFVPELDRLFVAAPAGANGHAAILVLAPAL
jgi:DNA-binding beta-propeller fold protein YncE